MELEVESNSQTKVKNYSKTEVRTNDKKEGDSRDRAMVEKYVRGRFLSSSKCIIVLV